MSGVGETAAAAGAGAARSIARAARETGADFEYLMKTARRESNFDVRAQARTSSAAGLFQFIEQTWLAMVHRHGEKHGLGEAAAAIREDAAGRFRIDDPAMREQVLALRLDPDAASLMAGELARENAARLRGALGRDASAGELYAAHFLGPSGASRLIKTAQSDPAARADLAFPQAAEANRPIFFDGARPRTVSEVLANLTGEAAQAAERRQRPDAPTDHAMADFANRGSVASPIAAAGGGVLTPAMVEILASLDAPRKGGDRGGKDS